MLLLLHVTVLFVAFDGYTVALSEYPFPASSVIEVVFRLTDVGLTVLGITLTVQLAVLPFEVFVVIVAVPAAFAVT